MRSMADLAGRPTTACDGSRPFFLKSDQWAENYFMDRRANQEERRQIFCRTRFYDRVFLQGVSDEMITVDAVTHIFEGQVVEGIGIYAAGYLEAATLGMILVIFRFCR